MLETQQILKVLYIMIIREYDTRHGSVMKYHQWPARRLGRAVDVPSALSIDREHGREGMPGNAR